MLKQIPARGFDLSIGTNLDRSTSDRSLVTHKSDATGGLSIRKLEGTEFCPKSMQAQIVSQKQKMKKRSI